MIFGRFIRYLLVGAALCFLSGCAFSSWWDATEQSETDISSVENVAEEADSFEEVDQVPTSVPADGGAVEVSGVEVVWQVPLKPVEVYHLRYGFSPTALNEEIVVPIDKLEKSDHPAFGPVYKYQLRNVSAERDVFVTLQAENRLGTSAPSEVMTIPAVRARAALSE